MESHLAELASHQSALFGMVLAAAALAVAGLGAALLAAGRLRQTSAEALRRSQEHRRKDALLARTSALARVGGWEFDVASGEGAWTEEGALRHSEERFQQLAENVLEVFWMTDPAKRQMLYLSPAYERVWGRSIDSALANPLAWVEAIHEEDRERVLDQARSRQVDGTYDEQYRIVRPDGSVRWIHDRAFPVRNEAGDVYRIVGVAEDVTETRAAEEERAHMNERLRRSEKLEAIGRYGELGRGTTIRLYLSGNTADAVGRHGVLEQRIDSLEKPYTLDSLATSVRQVLERD